MRVVELSQRPDAARTEARQRHEQAVAAANKALAQHRERLAQIRSRREEARAGRQWYAWLPGGMQLSRELQNVPSALPVAPEVLLPVGPEVLERQQSLRAEVTGEREAESALGRIFGDGWVLLRGTATRPGKSARWPTAMAAPRPGGSASRPTGWSSSWSPVATASRSSAWSC